MEKKKFKIDKVVVGISTVIFALIFLVSLIDSEGFIGYINAIVYFLCDNLGWLLNLLTLMCFIFALYFLFSKYGKIRLGGPDAKPEFKTFTWWGMSVCAGMGMGIVFWPAAEVIEYTYNPAVGAGLEAGSHPALIWAEAQTMNHWVITLYAVYVAAGIVAAYVYHNMKQPFSISATLYPLAGKKVYKFRSILDGIVTFAIVGGVAGSFGYGVLQVSDGLGQLFGVPNTAVTWVIIAVVIAAVYIVSSVSGLKKGIQWLGDNNAKLFILLLVFVAVFGPTIFSCNLGTEAAGDLVVNFFKYITFTEPRLGADKWSVWWNWLWYIDYFIFAPTTAFFLARLAKGRTLRQFIVVNMVAPGVFCMIWTWLFGGLAAHAQISGAVDLYAVIQEKGYEAVMLTLFETLPLATIMKAIMLVIVVISFITLANAITSTVAKMSLKNTTREDDEEDAPKGIQIYWGILMLAVTILFILFGGLDGAKAVKLLVGFPVVILESIVILGFWRMFIKKKYVEAAEMEPEAVLEEAGSGNIENVKNVE
ncbi:MAG TPA: BCCT transporter [Lachnospiraceae bacterium]|nr:BCCT transporter [Lachnospiraceae bacterium]